MAAINKLDDLLVYAINPCGIIIDGDKVVHVIEYIYHRPSSGITYSEVKYLTLPGSGPVQFNVS